MKATWEPHEKHGQLTTQSDLPDSVFAFPKQRKEPLTDARHVRNAVARFDQVIDVTDADRALAFANIQKAAKHYGIELSETSWHALGLIRKATAKMKTTESGRKTPLRLGARLCTGPTCERSKPCSGIHQRTISSGWMSSR
jgi:hypothetical protein